jgi:N-glycosylase/DNA lyase
VRDYDLAATLDSGQAFRWRETAAGWEAVVAGRWVRLSATHDTITAEAAEPQSDWSWLERYLRLNDDFAGILASFPNDEPLRRAVAACKGLRLLRQEPWECLASFILSSTKQIAHIRQIVERLCQRFGPEVATPAGSPRAFAFAPPDRLAAIPEAELRACGMGFRAPYLRAAAGAVAEGALDLEAFDGLTLPEARAGLMNLRGVGRKIADCVLLFAGGFDAAFPVDVWVLKALRELYFPGLQPTRRELLAFTETHFGPHSGYAQQYLFHFMRTRSAARRLKEIPPRAVTSGLRPRASRPQP